MDQGRTLKRLLRRDVRVARLDDVESQSDVPRGAISLIVRRRCPNGQRHHGIFMTISWFLESLLSNLRSRNGGRLLCALVGRKIKPG